MAEAIRERVVELYDAYERRDFARVAEFIHDDIDWMIHGPVHVFPFVGQRYGKRQALDVLEAIAALYALESYRPETIIVDGDRAAVVSDVALRQRSTDRLLRFRVANFLRFKDGRVVEFREFANTFDLTEQALGRWLDIGAQDATFRQRPL